MNKQIINFLAKSILNAQEVVKCLNLEKEKHNISEIYNKSNVIFINFNDYDKINNTTLQLIQKLTK